MTRENLIATYNTYAHSNRKGLKETYKKFSNKKVRIFNNCQRDMMENNGSNGSIVHHNSYVFTYGYTYMKDGCRHFVYITPSNRYDIIVADYRDLVS